jgi:hypothetical protein
MRYEWRPKYIAGTNCPLLRELRKDNKVEVKETAWSQSRGIRPSFRAEQLHLLADNWEVMKVMGECSLPESEHISWPAASEAEARKSLYSLV